MKSKSASQPDELRMKAADFDRVMRGALGVPPPPPEPKKAKTAKKPAAKKSSKR